MKHRIGIGAAILLATTIATAQQAAKNEYPSYQPGASVRDGYTAEELRDAVVRGSTGQMIGDVEDLIIGPNGNLRRLVVSVDEGFLGIGGRRLAVEWIDLRVIARSEHGIEALMAPVTKQNVEKFGLFKNKRSAVRGGEREWRASELLGDTISLKDIENYGTVTDLMFDRNGQLRAIAASPDISQSILQFYAPYSGDDSDWDPGDEYYTLPYSSKELREILPEDASLSAAAIDS